MGALVGCVPRRWSEVTRRLELWVQLRELNEAGEFTAVEVLPAKDVRTGGAFQLRQVQRGLHAPSRAYGKKRRISGDRLAPCRVSPGGSKWRCGRSQTRAPCPSSLPPSSPFPSEMSKFARHVHPKANGHGLVGSEQDLLCRSVFCFGFFFFLAITPSSNRWFFECFSFLNFLLHLNFQTEEEEMDSYQVSSCSHQTDFE